MSTQPETLQKTFWRKKAKSFFKKLSTPIWVIFFVMVAHGNSYSISVDTLIQTAHQTFNSRIYLMDGQGSTLNYYEYENYRLVDMTIADDEVYVADAFGPVVLKVDLETGTLEQFILELPHTAYYGLAYDSTFFYVEDFGVLYRYDEQGEQQSSTSFGETIFGMAWDGQYLWTIIEEDDMVRCWDLSAWPELTEIEDNAIAKPSDACRGLFFDGEYFWTSEAHETIPGNSYRFDHEGNIIETHENANQVGWGIAAKLDTTTTAISKSHSSQKINSYFDDDNEHLIFTPDKIPGHNLHIKIFDLQGRIMKSATLLNEGKKRYTVQLHEIDSGIYLFSLTVGNKTFSGKFRVKR